jgi:hypothetical protein
MMGRTLAGSEKTLANTSLSEDEKSVKFSRLTPVLVEIEADW